MADTVKIAVCDDEKNIRSYLVSLIKKQDRECSITEYASADAYLSDGREYDLIFLDIGMGGFGAGLDGMGLARHIRGIPVSGKARGRTEICRGVLPGGGADHIGGRAEKEKTCDPVWR